MKRIVLATALLIFVVLGLGPSICLLVEACFVDGRPSLENFETILLNERQLGLLWHSIALGFLSTFCTCLIGVPFGAVLARLKLPFEGVLRFLFLVPVMLPTYIIGITWTEHLPLSGLWGSVFLLTTAYWPVVALFTEKGIRAVDRSMEDAARMMTRPGRVFSSITLRLAMPSILTGALLVFIFVISDFCIPDLLSFTSTSSYQVFTSEIFYRWSERSRPGEAAAASLPVILIALAALALILRLESKAARAASSGRFVPVPSSRGGIWTVPVLLFLFFAVAVSVVVPLATLYLWLARAGGPAEMADVFVTSLSSVGMDAFNSIAYSALAAALMVSIGFFLAYLVERSGRLGGVILSFLILLPLVFPAVMVGVGEIRFWNSPANPLSDVVYETDAMLVFTYFARFIPIAVLSLRSSMKQVDRRVEEASAMAGTGFLPTMTRILMPLTFRGIWVSFLLGYILCMRELDTIAIIGAGNNTLPFRIYSQIHTSRDVSIAALCLVLVLTLLLPPLIYRLFIRGRIKIV